jgi:hypothetical protein
MNWYVISKWNRNSKWYVDIVFESEAEARVYCDERRGHFPAPTFEVHPDDGKSERLAEAIGNTAYVKAVREAIGY